MNPLVAFLPDITPILPGLVFYALSVLAVVAALAAATARKIVHAAFGLMATFFGVAGLYGLLGADYLAMTQIVVYVGGILVLLVFGVLLTGRAKGQLGLERPAKVLWPAIAGGALLVGLLLAIGASDLGATGVGLLDLAEPRPTASALGRTLLDPDEYLFPFEFVSVFLLSALVGAAFLVRRRRDAS